MEIFFMDSSVQTLTLQDAQSRLPELIAAAVSGEEVLGEITVYVLSR